MFVSASEAATYALAGNATFTLRSKRTGEHYTFQLSKPADKKDGNMYFAALLTGPDNEQDYTYMGIVTAAQGFRFTRKSKLTSNSTAVKAFLYFYNNCIVAGKMPNDLEVNHCGKCGRCNRALTVPESVALGIGPDCAEKMGLTMPVLDRISDETPTMLVSDPQVSVTKRGVRKLAAPKELKPIWQELNDDISDVKWA